MAAQIRVETIAGPSDKPERVILTMQYFNKFARLDLPVPPPLFDGEPGLDGFKRELHELTHALDQWTRSQGQIEWRS
jgi:hypothetical protein